MFGGAHCCLVKLPAAWWSYLMLVGATCCRRSHKEWRGWRSPLKGLSIGSSLKCELVAASCAICVVLVSRMY